MVNQPGLPMADHAIAILVDNLLENAIEKNASDIHIEPYQDKYSVRFRIQGLRQLVSNFSLSQGLRVISRLKILANTDISETRLPQEGRFSFKEANFRLSVCPTLQGEKIVLRLLILNQGALNFSELGLLASQHQACLNAIHKPQGLILFTGPTGAGKTVSLYAALQCLDNNRKHIITAEDPVEIRLPGITQVNVNPEIGLSFATCLRAFLRQDPDVILIGEIRDPETAKIAIQAAETGHLVFSTLHCADTTSALTRLQHLYPNTLEIANALSLIVAQRLVRTSHSKGRTGIFECLTLTPMLKRMILEGKSEQDIRHSALKSGLMPLKKAATLKVSAGLTTLAEIRRTL